jgi:hypothetical protein
LAGAALTGAAAPLVPALAGVLGGVAGNLATTARKRDDCRPSDAYLETLAERIGDFINSSREGIAALKSDQLNLSETQSPGYLSP